MMSCVRQVSYQWAVQATVQRIVADLSRRDYIVWFDLDSMKGSLMDGTCAIWHQTLCSLTAACNSAMALRFAAMSEAVEGAAVMLYAASSLYKESANW